MSVAGGVGCCLHYNTIALLFLLQRALLLCKFAYRCATLAYYKVMLLPSNIAMLHTMLLKSNIVTLQGWLLIMQHLRELPDTLGS